MRKPSNGFLLLARRRLEKCGFETIETVGRGKILESEEGIHLELFPFSSIVGGSHELDPSKESLVPITSEL